MGKAMMLDWTLGEVAAACDGALEHADEALVVRSVVTDSRRAADGALFVALTGEHADGHEYVADAIGRGAVAALVRGETAASMPAVRVADPLGALQRLAEAARARLDATVIAITGSSGKTGTKDMVRAACERTRRTVASEASYNNEIGVPLTILSADAETEVLVVEVGSRGVGHIASLMPVVRPRISIVTNVGSAHVGMFGSVDRTALAKGELVEGLPADGVAVLNADDALVRAMRDRTQGRVLLAGRSEDADVRATDVVLDADARAQASIIAGDERARLAVRIPGEHVIANATLAVAAAWAAGVPLAEACAGASSCEPTGDRMRVMETARGVRIVNDAYNANPESTAAALKTLAAMAGGRPTWAVLGHMAELGDDALAGHDRVGRLAVRLGTTHLVTVGEEARAIHEAARLEGMFGGEAMFAASMDDAIRMVSDGAEDDAVILVKASRAVGLERLAAALLEAFGGERGGRA